MRHAWLLRCIYLLHVGHIEIHLLQLFRHRRKAGTKRLNWIYIIASLSIVLCFEDIDSYAINSFLFGMIIGSVLKKESTTAKNTVAHAG